MKRRSHVIIIIMLLLSILTLTRVNTYIVLYDIRNQTPLMHIPIDSESSFRIRWIHSVELEPWEEIFRIDADQNIFLDSTRFKAFGAGVPDSAGKRVDTSDGYINFLEINRPMPNLTYGISPIAKHTLIVGTVEYPLFELLPHDIGVQIKVERKRKYETFLMR